MQEATIRPPEQVTYGKKEMFVYYSALSRALAEQGKATLVVSQRHIEGATNLVKMVVREKKAKITKLDIKVDEHLIVPDLGLTGDKKPGLTKEIVVTNFYFYLTP
jgi:hypothetical protein